MESKTKNLLADDKIRELVRIHFGDACEVSQIEELKGGMFNAIYRITCANGIARAHGKNQIVLKVGVVPGTPLLTYEQDVMPTEVECYRLIREQTSVPVPEMLAYDFSKTHIASNYFFMTVLEGETLQEAVKKISPENLKRIREQQAEYFGQIHRIKGPYYGYFSEKKEQQYPTWKDAFFHMCGQILADAKERGTMLPYEKIRCALKENERLLEELKEPALVEYDCHDGNVFVKETADGYEIEGIVDFERAFWGDPLADFPAAFIMTDDIRKEQAFLERYLAVSHRQAFTEDDAKRCQLYRLYISTIMAAETFRYESTYAAFQGKWAKEQIQKCLKALGQ